MGHCNSNEIILGEKKMIKVGIIGSTGYAGAELVKILSGHPEVVITALTSRQYIGKPFSDVYPALRGIADTKCQDLDVDLFCEDVDFAFVALPHKLPMKIIPKLIERGVKVVDLSADFRFDNVELYESYYQEHSEVELLSKSVYGLSEIYKDDIINASLIGNPGCYPTTVLLALIPLIRSGLIKKENIIADSKSGVSGAGRSLSLATHYCEINESFKAYGLDGHRHRPEMEEVLSKESGDTISITFIPHLLPMTRGMLTTLYTQTEKNIGKYEIENCYNEFYKEKKFVRIYTDSSTPPALINVQNSNFCDIGFSHDEESGRLVIVSTIDNLVKGAAGQAVQNMNIMLGIDETTGLI